MRFSKTPEVNRAVVPVTVSPESCVVKTPETPVTDVALTVSPVIVAPDICVVKTPETKLAVVPVTVAPVTVVNPAVLPVNVPN